MTFRRPVERDHVRPLLKLKVKPDQQEQVASNAATLAQQAYEPNSYVWGLWDGDTPVGLLAMLDPAGHPDEEQDKADAAYVWRLMIDSAHQGNGYGLRALGEVLAVAQEWGRSRVMLSAVERDGGAIAFYEKYGFDRTGRIVWGEVEMSVPVDVLRDRLAR
ncbi:MAG: GNAT family N-acetyltransferase [Pseudomonadota bacterium]